MRRAIHGDQLFLMLLLLSTSNVNAASSVWYSGAQFQNHSNSPIWVTIYESSLPLGPWKIVKPECVFMQANGSWSWLPTAVYMKIRAQAIKGHGNCNDGTYWDGSVSGTANMNDATMSAQFNALPGDASKLSSP
jgi:hypothetical protein